ncbi:gag-pol polyprotein [Lasius niger]|uniref:Gag-pol polyprotein n=1 Tax=Lasius niger TaxID=67767 RepID=A0A0J7K6F6_LASNI|nr:gag-pol polyprotein [Lasius niger]
MCVSDAEIGERTVFEGSPSESQEDEITKNKAKNKRVAIPQKRKRKRKSLILDSSEEELEFPELRNKRDRAIADELRNIKEMTTTSLATLLLSWINECENVRQISTSFKVTTSEQDTTEAQYTEDGYPKDGEPWTTVIGRKKKKQLQSKQQVNTTIKKTLPILTKQRGTLSPRKEKKTATVATTAISDEISYKDLMQLAKKNISLENLKIDDIDCRRAMTGGLLL